jgi:hypothetical protein
MSEYTTFLFARPSFFEGIARILDFGNTLQVYNESADPAEADAWALASDWHAIGEDMMRAVNEIKQARTTVPQDEQTQPEQSFE